MQGMKKTYLLIIALFAILVVRTAFATNETCFCHNVNNNPHTICTSNQGQINGHTGHVNNGTDTFGACQSPTNTPTPTQEPTPSCSVTPRVTVTPTPTDTVTPTPTPTETITPTPTPEVKHEEPKVAGSSASTNAPTNSCPIEVGKVDALNVETGVPNDNAIELYWTPISQADKVNIYYGTESGVWIHSVIRVEDNGHFQVSGLQNGQHYFFTIEGVAGVCTGPRSAIIDPLP